MAQTPEYTVRLTPEARVALAELGKLYPRDVSLTQLASQAISEKLEREKK